MKQCRLKVFGEKLPEWPELEHIDLTENKIKALTELAKFK